MFTLKDSTLSGAWFLALALLCSAPNIQTPAAPSAAPLATEPHHKLVFENPYVRVFLVNIPPHDATLLHQHDLPYVSVSLGPADFINAVAGRPEAHVVLADGQVGYSRGGFAHIARTDSGMVFNNVTIELLKPQGEPQNVCAKIIPGATSVPCPETPAGRENEIFGQPQFKTDEMTVRLGSHGPSGGVVGGPARGTLFVIVSGSEIQRIGKDQPEETLSAGNVVWLAPASNTTFVNRSGKPWTVLSLTFEDK